jgi:ubiquinone/menaquinone biosynthesis C-methylase UbiE
MTVEHWETYYRGGAIAACPMGPESSYTLELRDLWFAFFASLGDGARVLDVGTGNGAVVLFAKEAATAAGRRLEIHGADLAAIDPARHVRDGTRLFAGITFHPGTPCERLGFDDAGFDAVSGQYALEYTDSARSLAEVRRVLRPGGRALFVLHHDQSVLIRNARESLAQAALVLDETKILRKLRRHAAAERESAAAARATWAELSADATRLRQAAARSVAPHLLLVVIDGVQKLLGLRRELGAAGFEREVDRFEREVRSGVRRLQDLVGYAQSIEQMDAMVATARRIGLECSGAELQYHARENLVGWRLALTRA